MSANEEMKEELDREAVIDTLTPEERAALTDGDEPKLSAKEIEALRDIAGDEDAGDSDGADATNGQAADDGEQSVAAADDEPPKVEVDAADAGQPAVYRASLPEDFKARVEALEAADADIARKFEEGEIDAAEYVREMRRIAKERSELDIMRVKAEMSAEMAQQAAMQQWQQQVIRFMREVKAAEGAVVPVVWTATGVE